MVNEELKALLDRQSEPLEEALVPPEIEEISEEDMELATIGIIPSYATYYRKRPDAKQNVFYQGFPTNHFFEWYLNCCDQKMLDLLKEHKEKLRDSQKDLLEVAEAIEVVKENQGATIGNYIEKNKELIKEKDELFKRVQKLQEERDNALQNRYIENSEMLKYASLCKELVEIFIRNKVEDNISDENYELVNQIIKEVSK